MYVCLSFSYKAKIQHSLLGAGLDRYSSHLYRFYPGKTINLPEVTNKTNANIRSGRDRMVGGIFFYD
jgi:hypothetical protein